MDFRLRFSVFIFACVVCLLIEEARSQGCEKPSLRYGRVKMRAGGTTVYYRCRPKRKYVMIGSRFATCMGGVWSDPPPICAARNCPRPSITRVVSVELSNSGAMATFSCAPGYIMKGPNTAVCLAGKVWNGTAPQCMGPDGVYGMECTFENQFRCGWTQDKTDDFDWREANGDTPTANTGPSFDHTLGRGKSGTYLYIESSLPSNPYDTARLLSPVFGEKYSYSCFQFWYHLYGRVAVGHLRVYVKPVNKELSELEPRFEVSGNQGNVWKKGMITIEILDTPFQIVIEAQRLGTYFSDIAIDDLKIDRCPPGVDPTNPSVIMNSTEIASTDEPKYASSVGLTNATTAAVTEATKGNTTAVTKATKGNTVAVTKATKGNTVSATEATKGNTAAVTKATQGNTVAATEATKGNTAAVTEATKGNTVAATEATKGNMAAVTEATKGNTAAVTKATQGNTVAATEATKGNTAAATEATKGNTAAVTKATKENTVAATEATKGNTAAATEATKGNTAAVTKATKGNTVAATEATKGNTAAVTEATKGNTAAVTEATKGNTVAATEATTGNTVAVTEATKGNTAAVTKATKGNTVAVTEATKANTVAVTEATKANTAAATEATKGNTAAVTPAVTKEATPRPNTPSDTKSGTGIVVYKPTKNKKNMSNAIDDKSFEVDYTDDNTLNMFPRTAGVASDNDALSYPTTIYVAVSIVAAFAVVFIVVGLVGYAVQRRRRPRRESQVEEMKPITSGDTLLEQWLSWRIYETVD